MALLTFDIFLPKYLVNLGRLSCPVAVSACEYARPFLALKAVQLCWGFSETVVTFSALLLCCSVVLRCEYFKAIAYIINSCGQKNLSMVN